MRLTRDAEAAGFRAGLADGADPRPPTETLEAGREVLTRATSPWANNAPCTICGQTFRVGDRVVLDEHGVRHLDPALACATEGQSGPDDAERGEFSRGLLAAWPPAGGVEPVRLTADDWQVARPGIARKQRCIQCGDTFRAGETVVICPCRPGGARDDPERCGQAIHRDPAAGLSCWEDWCPTGEVTLCPVNHTPVRRTAVVAGIRRAE